jgi:transcriptional regulator with XRE-family HTH domain
VVDHRGMANWDPEDIDAVVDIGRRLIGQAIRRGRLTFGLSQRQLAWRVGVNQSTVSRIETGKLAGVRWPTFARMIGMLYSAHPLTFSGEPPAPTRRLPGQRAE